MKILSASQIKDADAFTIKEEGITSIELMERAAKAFTGWFENKFTPTEQVFIFCGPGNNGGDGLAIARLLSNRNYQVQVYTVGDTKKASSDFKANLKIVPDQVKINRITLADEIPAISKSDLVIDALFGTGLNRPVSDLYGRVIEAINHSGACVTAVDIPSGLYTDSQTPEEGAIVEADHTVTFELPKLAFLLPQHETYVGKWHLVQIGLNSKFIADITSECLYTTHEDAKQLLKKRRRFSHKGIYGHALLMAGSYGKMGAAVLAARGCLRSGVGLLTLQAPSVGYNILQISVPEAMTLPDNNRKHVSELPADIDKFDVIGIGPGIGTDKATKTVLGQLLATSPHPVVIDADAINIIAGSDRLKSQLPKDRVILTPHPKEFERLIGKTKNDYDRLEHLKEFCHEYSCYVVLKGNNTAIGTPGGNIFFNSTGNSGMATGGTGDVLTGVITALAAQQYTLEEACILGVYVHGLAGDLALHAVGAISMTATDVTDHLPQAFISLDNT